MMYNLRPLFWKIFLFCVGIVLFSPSNGNIAWAEKAGGRGSSNSVVQVAQRKVIRKAKRLPQVSALRRKQTPTPSATVPPTSTPTSKPSSTSTPTPVRTIVPTLNPTSTPTATLPPPSTPTIAPSPTPSPTSTSTPKPMGRLILLDGSYGTTLKRSWNVARNAVYIDTLPFDGIAIDAPVSWLMMNGTDQRARMAEDYSSISPSTFSRLTFNFALVFANRPKHPDGTPADFFDDEPWRVIRENFIEYARVCKTAGFKGIVFDHEQYMDLLWQYPESVNYAKTYSLSDYETKVRQRGREIMEAMRTVFPDIEVIFPHGVNESSPEGWQPFRLAGAFVTGMVEGIGPHAQVHDEGEENYQLRTDVEFEDSYRQRKFDIATSATFIPEGLRSLWPSRIKVGFMTFNKVVPYYPIPMDPSIMRKITEIGLRKTDSYVLHYTQGESWLVPPGTTLQGVSSMPDEWRNAVIEARQAVLGK